MYCPSTNTLFDDLAICPACGLSEMYWTEYDEDTCQVDVDAIFPMTVDCCSPECATLAEAGLAWKQHTPSWREIVTIEEEKPITDPYGHLCYTCGDGEDFHCFDFAVFGDRVLLHSMVNSETGSFIMGSTYELYTLDQAVECAKGMWDGAVEWFYRDNDDPESLNAFESNQDVFIYDLKESIDQARKVNQPNEDTGENNEM